MTEPEKIWLARMPTKTADEARKRRELYLARQARYEASERARTVRKKYDANRSARDSHVTRKLERQNRPFIVWDGEQPRDTGYSLLGNSEGMEICHPNLSTDECLQLIIDTEILYPQAIHTIFGGDFDVSWWLKDLTWRQLGRLKHYNNTQWNGFEITHVPHKWFSVKYGKYIAKVHDTWSFFGSGLLPALVDWEIGPFTGIAIGRDALSDICEIPSLSAMDSMTEVEIIEIFKSLRGEFEWEHIEQIRRYMRIELKYTKEMLGKLRDIFLQAGYLPASWHGPGALSRMAAKRHSVHLSMAKCPRPVQIAARYGYFGGRFYPNLIGHMQRPVYSRDRNSAYPYAATLLPNLARGKWRFENEPVQVRQALDAGKFAIYNLTFDDRDPGTIGEKWFEHVRKTVWERYPLPMRSPYHSGISYPWHVTGWYWSPEANMVKDDPRVVFHGVWIFDEDDPADRPLAWMQEYYRRRLLLKRQGSPAEYTFKIIINGWYGQCAQRVGWDKAKNEPPSSHQLEWAGFITSHCRAAMWEMAQRVGWDSVISIDTDGIMTLVPIPAYDGEIGDGLGQYKDEVYEDGVFWQSGVYGLMLDGKWKKAKTRGIPKGKYDPGDLVRLVAEGAREFTVERPRFIGYGMAFNSQFEKHNVWITEPQKYVFGGEGARIHRMRECAWTCPGNGIHLLKNNFAPDEFGRTGKDHGYKSAPHFLPWEENTPEMTEHMKEEDDQTWYYIGSDDL
jgi:hypothetical protein